MIKSDCMNSFLIKERLHWIPYTKTNKPFLIFRTDYSLHLNNLLPLKKFFKDITESAIYKEIPFRNSDGVKNIPSVKGSYLEPEDIENIQKETKLIFYFNDFWCTKTENEKDDIINSGGIITADIYGWLYPQLKALNILHNTYFISPTSLNNVKVYPNFKIIYFNEPFNRYIRYSYKHSIPIQYNHKFIWLNRRPRPHRVYALYKLVEANLIDGNAIFSFHNFGYDRDTYFHNSFMRETVASISNGEFNTEITDELTKNYLDVPAISPTYDIANDRQQYSELNNLNTLYKDCWLELVSEYNYSNHKVFLTEKIARSIILKKPFVVFGDRYTLKELHNLGFKTFAKFWDESYDALPSIKERIDTAVETIVNIFQTYNWHTQIPSDMQEIIDYNYNHYYGNYKQQAIDAWTQIL